jgi:hypothetical protein
MMRRVGPLTRFVLVVVATCATAADTALRIDPRSLVEVRTLAALPKDVSSSLGWQKAGVQGIADVREKFNATDVVDKRLPMRRFLVGGASSNSVVVAYEQGGRSRSIHAVAFSLGSSGWSQVGEWTLNENPYTLRGLLEVVDSKNYPNEGRKFLLLSERMQKVSERIGKTRPSRRDGPLRETNLNDEEVREIQAVAHGVVPDSLVNISGVVTGCPCEEGSGCLDQVWIVAYRPGEMKGLQLSRINGRWELGVVQQWWLDREKLERWWLDSAKREGGGSSYSSYVAYEKAQQALYDRFPVCTAERAVGPAQSPSRKPP